MKVVGIIPARMASTRLPGKPLVKILGHSMIEHVYRRSLLSHLIDDLFVATCDHEIAEEVKKFGGKAIMTSTTHKRGTERVAEAVQNVKADLVINIQGDEPTISPDFLDKAIRAFQENQTIQCLNLISRINDWEHFSNPNIVKVVLGIDGKVLYFSRSPIPYMKKESFKLSYKQMGVYLITRELLLSFARWGEGVLEREEGIDMLRFIERGISVQALIGDDMSGVDTPEDVMIAEKVLSNDRVHQQIFG